MTKGEELLQRFLNGGMSIQEVLEYKKEVDIFFQSDAPKEDKKRLSGYMETLNMICNGIKEGLLKEEDLIELKPRPKKNRKFEIPEFLRVKEESKV